MNMGGVPVVDDFEAWTRRVMIFGVFRHVSGVDVTIARPWSNNDLHPVITIGARWIKVMARRLGRVGRPFVLNEWTHVSIAFCDCGLDQEETPE